MTTSSSVSPVKPRRVVGIPLHEGVNLLSRSSMRDWRRLFRRYGFHAFDLYQRPASSTHHE